MSLRKLNAAARLMLIANRCGSELLDDLDRFDCVIGQGRFAERAPPPPGNAQRILLLQIMFDATRVMRRRLLCRLPDPAVPVLLNNTFPVASVR
jgi:hypothetical protein